MTLKKNIFANYLGSGMTSLAPILALPWYLEALGPKQFGLIGFIVMLQAVLGLIDAGMSQALVREIAVRLDSTTNGQRSAAYLLFGFERIYWLFALCAGCITLLLSNAITTHWLHLGDLPLATGKTAIFGAAAIFAAQFPGSVYRSMLVAAQAQLTLNGIMLSAALARHVGGVIVVLIWPTLLAYLTWHATIALLETLVRGKLAWKTLGVIRNQVKWKTKELRPAWKLIASMSGAILLGALTVQMDRIILSRMTSIDQFGYYTVAATVALGSLQLINPLTQAILPRAIQMRADPIALHSLNIKLARIIALIVGVGALIFITIGKWILDIWLRNPLVVTAVHPLLAILLIGTCLNAFYNVGYMNWIAQEKVHRIFQVNALALLLSVTLIPPLILWQGTIGAAFGWLIINLIGFVFSLGWIKWKTNKSMVKQ